MAEFKWDHVHLRSPDPETAAKFYVDMLGAKSGGVMMNGDKKRAIVELGGLPVFIEQVPAATPRAPGPPFVGGVEHIGLEVKDLDAVAAELKARGVVFTMEPNSPRPGVKICFVQAPDGVRVELLERSPA